MKILVTGHKGFIGQNMVKYLEERNHEVVGYEWGDGPYSLKGVDQVIHLGAISHTTTANVPQLLEQNYYFSIHLLQKCSVEGIPIQVASSASLYGPSNTTFREEDRPEPRNHYAWSKFMVEEYFNTHPSTNTVQFFRYFNVYGPHEDHKGLQASPHHQFLTQARQRGVIEVFEGSENYKRDFVPVDYITHLHERFFTINKSGIWNFGTGLATSFLDVANKISKATNSVIKFIPMPENLKYHYQKFTKANTDKLDATLLSI